MFATDETSAIPANAALVRTRWGSQAIRVSTGCISVWLLGYYLLANTVFERISPGGLIVEAMALYPAWLFSGATVVLCVFSLLALAPRQASLRHFSRLPIWLLILFFWTPIAGICLQSSLSGPNARLCASILVAMAVGIVGARVAVDARQVSGVLSVIGTMEAVYTLTYQHARIHGLLSGEDYRAGGTFNDPNALYTLMLIALPFSITGAVRAETGPTRLFFLAASAAEFSALLLTLSRGGILGAGAAVVALTYFTTGSRRVTTLVIAGALVVAFFVQMDRATGVVNSASASRSASGRPVLMKDGWRAFMNEPLTGVGVNSFHVSWVTKTAHMEMYNVVDDPKNLMVDWLAERGIFGGVLFGLFVWTIIGLVQRALAKPVAIATGAAWIGLLIAGLVDTPFGPASRYVGNCCFGFLLGVTACLPMTELSKKGTPSMPVSPVAERVTMA